VGYEREGILAWLAFFAWVFWGLRCFMNGWDGWMDGSVGYLGLVGWVRVGWGVCMIDRYGY